MPKYDAFFICTAGIHLTFFKPQDRVCFFFVLFYSFLFLSRNTTRRAHATRSAQVSQSTEFKNNFGALKARESRVAQKEKTSHAAANVLRDDVWAEQFSVTGSCHRGRVA